MLKKILILDDDKGTLEVLNIIFSEQYLVQTTENSIDFKNSLKAFNPDLVMIDFMLREATTGEDLCFAIRSDPLTSHIPVIVLSVVDNLKLSPDLQNCHFISKPFDLFYLTDKVNEFLGEEIT